MKKLLLLLTFLSIASITYAQISKTVNLATAGTLSTSLSLNEFTNITNLTITGTIDARDFKTMRDEMPLLAVLDLSGATIAAYKGTAGTSITFQTNYPANTIPESAFLNMTWQGKISLTSIIFPVSLTAIGEFSFYSCRGLTGLVIPSSVTSIGSYAFSMCKGLTVIAIPYSVTSIGVQAFSHFNGLITVDPDNLNYSSHNGVLFNKTQTELIQCPVSKTGNYAIPPSVTTIGSYAFIGCSGLSSVTIPALVVFIGVESFSGSNALIIVDPDNLNYSSHNGVLFNKTQTELIQCPVSKTGNYTIPPSVKTIGSNAFFTCRGLTTITIPSSVTSVGSYAFGYCSGLTSITIPSSVTTIGSYAFDSCSGLTSVTIPSSITTISESTFLGCSNMVFVTIPPSVITIQSFAFYGCRSLISVSIPSSVTSMGSYAFYNCTNLISITTSRITPIDLSASTNIFQFVDKTTCKLYVPVGSKSAYQVATKWKDFTNIVEYNVTGISPLINNHTLTIYPNPTTGKIRIVFNQIPEKGTILTVTDFTGKTILTQLIQNKEEWIDLGGNLPGFYLIRTSMKDFKVQKVILK